jgi:hypothetical protein
LDGTNGDVDNILVLGLVFVLFLVLVLCPLGSSFRENVFFELVVDISVEFGAENTVSISRDSASAQGESTDAQGDRI